MIDTHSHYDCVQFEDDRHQKIQSIFDNGVKKIITCATNFEDAKKVLELCSEFDEMYAAIGIYPHETAKYSWDEQRLTDLLNNKKVVALGEIGLDYHSDESPKSVQLEWVNNQLSLANKLNLPVSFHDREAHMDTLNVLKKHKPKGSVHCFSGSVEMAREIVKLNMFIGVGGVVTFKNARVLVDVVADTPIEHILLETDAPYLSPVPFRGHINRSDYLIYVANRIAEIKNMDVQSVINATEQNAVRLFNL